MGIKQKPFADRVLEWAHHSGRQHLPWQKHRSVYRVWISEVMLQQTQVDTVIPYFEKFMQSFPDVGSLASATQDYVLHHWSGLGYYARARNLHKAAQIIVDEYGGDFPLEIEQVMALPGIGRSTAGAILSLSFNQHHAILDGNVKRVLARHTGTYGWPGNGQTEKILWQHAEQRTPKKDNAAYTQAMMDLGALLCTRSQADCERCPVQKDCFAYQTHEQSNLPTKKPKKDHPEKEVVMLVINSAEQGLLMQRRPNSGIWGGLLSFPEFESILSAIEWFQNQFSQNGEDYCEHDQIKHVFSHYSLNIQPISLQLENPSYRVMEQEEWVWYKVQQTQAGVAAPVTQLLKQLCE
jgi:A/G-specific adenine glycosylase